MSVDVRGRAGRPGVRCGRKTLNPTRAVPARRNRVETPAGYGRPVHPIHVREDSPTRADVVALLTEHLADMYATSPAESVHALDPSSLATPEITFVTARDGAGRLLGCGALKALDPRHGELKSMRTAAGARGRGVATRVLTHLLAVAAGRGYTRVSLETGAEEYFAPARRLYVRHGFVPCPPFAAYVPDPHSVFLTLTLPHAAPEAAP